jgi:S1-C subfamily serine protease
MQKPNYALISCVVVLAILVGMVGGGVMGGLAGYYAAQNSLSNAASLASAAVTSPTSNVQPAPLQQTNLTLKEDSAVIDAVRKVKPAVVTVINNMQPRRGFFGTFAPTASGSGVIVDAKGYIITNNHVIAGQQSLQVIFSDGSKADATIVGADSVSDIAVLKVDKVPAVATLGDSNALEPGQVAIAIGSPLGDYRGTVTVGVVSGLNRRVGQQQGLIQTDAAINNGNSGGPLINTLGQVIGINTLVVRSTNDGNVAEGLGFAIPSNQVREIMTQLIAHGHVDRAYLGITYQEVNPQIASALNLNTTDGVVITQVDAGTPAARAGLQEGDVILEFDGQKIDQDHSLQSLLFTRKAGDTVTLTVLRGSQTIPVKVTLSARPTS